MKVLKLTLKKHWFDIMITGEKTNEYRKAGKWIKSRLVDKNGNPKHYDAVQYTNGYGAKMPYFTCAYNGFVLHNNGVSTATYSNGMSVSTSEPTYDILNGKILATGNLNNDK